MKENLTTYELSRYWFDFCNNNSEIIKPIHTALYFYILDLCNRLGNPQSFKFPKEFAMQALGISNWRTYANALNNIVDWGFLIIESKSKNQNSATVVAIVKNTIAIKLCSCKKYNSEYNSKYNSNVGVINNIPTNVVISLKNNKTNKLSETRERGFSQKQIFEKYKTELLLDEIWIEQQQRNFKLSTLDLSQQLDAFFGYLISIGEESTITTKSDAKRRFYYWLKNPKESQSQSKHPKDWKKDLMQSTLDECNKL